MPPSLPSFIAEPGLGERQPPYPPQGEGQKSQAEPTKKASSRHLLILVICLAEESLDISPAGVAEFREFHHDPSLASKTASCTWFS